MAVVFFSPAHCPAKLVTPAASLVTGLSLQQGRRVSLHYSMGAAAVWGWGGVRVARAFPDITALLLSRQTKHILDMGYRHKAAMQPQLCAVVDDTS